MKKRIPVMSAIAALALVGPAYAQKVHLYTPQEQAAMTEDGSIATMTTPSELRELFENAGKVVKPTGHITYCNAGVLGLSARSRALKAIDASCGGTGQYTLLRAGPMVDAVSTAFGTSCKRSEMIVFRCEAPRRKAAP